MTRIARQPAINQPPALQIMLTAFQTVFFLDYHRVPSASSLCSKCSLPPSLRLSLPVPLSVRPSVPPSLPSSLPSSLPPSLPSSSLPPRPSAAGPRQRRRRGCGGGSVAAAGRLRPTVPSRGVAGAAVVRRRQRWGARQHVLSGCAADQPLGACAPPSRAVYMFYTCIQCMADAPGTRERLTVLSLGI